MHMLGLRLLLLSLEWMSTPGAVVSIVDVCVVIVCGAGKAVAVAVYGGCVVTVYGGLLCCCVAGQLSSSGTYIESAVAFLSEPINKVRLCIEAGK